MHKLIAVEEAKSLMTEAQNWSMWSWLTEKRKLRTAADRAWEALEEAEEKVRSSWSDELKAAYGELHTPAGNNGHSRPRRKGSEIPQEILEAAGRWKEAWDEADAAHQDAEETFEQAERRMSTSMACEGARKAIMAWEMREKVIRKAEGLRRKMAEE